MTLKEFLFEFLCEKSKIRTYSIAFLMLLSASCVEYPHYPPEPHIEYVSAIPFFGEDELGNKEKIIRITFMLYDGDGDIGHGQATPTEYDFFSTIYIQKNGTFHLLSDFIANNSNYTLPQLRANNNKKFIKAEVQIDITYSSLSFPYDTAYVSFYVKDRAGNISNTDSSDVVIFR